MPTTNTQFSRNPIISGLLQAYLALRQRLQQSAAWLPPFLIRMLLAWEFLESGLEKYHGQNWFADIMFPFPFNLLPVDISWQLATYVEILGACALLLGLATRFFALSLMILTVVAILSVHAPEHATMLLDWLQGYRIVDETGDGYGNYKLPLIYLVMFLPLLLGGAGKLSLDHYLGSRLLRL